MKKIESYQTHNQKGILLNANEVSDNIDEILKKQIKERIDFIDFNRYPDTDCIELRKTYGNYIHMPYEQILCGNGSDQMLDLIMSYYCSSNKTVLTLDPDFGMYDFYASRYDAKVIKYTCKEDGSFDVDDFISFGKQNKVDFIIFSNPNNPSGHYLENKDILKIVKAFPDIPFVDDEAYIEFAKESMMEYIDQFPNFFITRTLSKVFGMAAIRTGFLIGSKQNIERLSNIKVPYALNTVSQQIAICALHSIETALNRVQPICQRREQLLNMKFKDITIYPSHANFVLVKATKLDVLKTLFEQNHIQIRTYNNKDYIRITIGNELEHQQVISIFNQYQEAL
ncbi:pyridoxal phosphate-dependent aminotransferase [Floccifex sp.]|uniref:pyridoxal phosphate-dependent aminotransferase n=1 Tax=Floccifex sp. TaxID=2815810 RepID=UPI003F030283